MLLILGACSNQNSAEHQTTLDCQPAVDGMHELRYNLTIPDNFNAWNYQEAVRLGDEFDVNQYFDVLTDISMEPGYTLDYVYSTALYNGYPILYARRDDTERYATFSEYRQAVPASGTESEFFWSRLGDMMNDDTEVDFDLPDETYMLLNQGYLAHVVVNDDGENGYLQLALLYILGDQFYLQWHANYDDDTIICNQEHLSHSLAEHVDWMHLEVDTEEIVRGVDGISLEPEVIVKNSSVEVSLVLFTKWGGLFRVSYEISRDRPYIIIETERENIYDYYCGIVF